MLGDLKILEDKLFTPQVLEWFHQKYNIYEVIKQLNKSTKKQTRQRIQYYFGKLGQSNHYKDYLFSFLTQDKQNKKEFIKYVSSEYSQQFFILMQNKKEDVLFILENHQNVIPVVIKLISFQYGIKLIKLFKELYEEWGQKYQCLFHVDIRKGLEQGLGFMEGDNQVQEGVDTVAQMRYLQIVVNIALIGGNCFNFVAGLLDKGLSLYKTEDILLKMAFVQIISVLGDGVQTSKLLRQHKIWKFIQKDAFDPDQQFYVKKFLLILLIDMSNQGHYQINHKMIKDLHEFLIANIKSKGQYLQAAIDVITHLFKTAQGCKIVIQNSQIFNNYIQLSHSTADNIKKPFYDSLIALTYSGRSTTKQTKESPKYKLVINVLNCIGKPSLATQLTQNFHANNYMVSGLEAFNKWFNGLLLLPFEEIQLRLIEIFLNILNYYQIIESLLQNQQTTKYLLKSISSSDTNRNLKSRKTNLINTIINKGTTDWAELQLSQYSRSLQKLLKTSKEEMVYALDIQ